ncbi:MAG: adenylosuccinate lyase [Ignavibacteria bacterium]|nr:MAG: adenylosuccinate lyase [Chlorobiota bacterium]MBV6399500.1 Adenylosuccinate lyase [Ignavibacteria bacterium]MCC6886656.1 adenylosuccinate lyase [Ignavibacteriales bacterium]MCE7953205.1 adenylosuccinate lyase [Chlorobi bacterium CHB7]RIK50073.1 MAG: adenylosuccinate lyase [Ignavibacteriota bacterium]
MIERYSRKQMADIWSDHNKFSIWLEIEILACEAQHKLGLIPLSAIRNIKKKARFDTKEILKIEDKVKHDVIAFLTNVNQSIGIDSRFIHKGMTSSDIIDTAFSVQLKQAGYLLLKNLKQLEKILASKARKYKYLPMVGRTHGVHAEPITLGLKFALWYDENQRNIVRLKRAIDVISVGQISGAVGTYEHISPKVEQYVCRKLGLKNTRISTQILQRDRHAEYMATLAIIATCIEKYATEIRHLQKTETLELEEPFSKGQKGSSAMPHKKNPIACERLSGLARVFRGNTIAALENIPLWHERDISHSSTERIIFPDSTILLDYILTLFKDVISNIVVNKNNLKRNLELTNGLVFSQNVLLKLTEKKMSREQAYKIVQDVAMKCWKENISFEKLLSEDTEVKKYLSESDLKEIFDYSKSKRNIDFIFKRLNL